MVRADRAARRLVDVGRVAEALVRAVPAFVRAEVDVAVRVRAADHLLGRPDVVRVGRPDEPVGRDRERVLGRLEELDLLVDELARRSALVDGGLGDVDRVLVGAGQEARVVADHPMPARDHVGADHLVQRVDAGLGVGVRDGRGQVVTGTVGHGSAMVPRASRAGTPMAGLDRRRTPGRKPTIRTRGSRAFLAGSVASRPGVTGEGFAVVIRNRGIGYPCRYAQQALWIKSSAVVAPR